MLLAFQSYLTVMKNVFLVSVTTPRSSCQCRYSIKVDFRLVGSFFGTSLFDQPTYSVFHEVVKILMEKLKNFLFFFKFEF